MIEWERYERQGRPRLPLSFLSPPGLRGFAVGLVSGGA